MRIPLAVALAACLCLFVCKVPSQGPLRDIEPGAASSIAVGFTPIEGAVLFVATSKALGTEIWRSDGTQLGTTVLDLAPGAASGADISNQVKCVHRFGSTALLFGTDGGRTGLFVTDGTKAGTSFLATLPLGGFSSRKHSDVVDLGGRGCFGVSPAGQDRSTIYVTDGTATGTMAVASMTGTILGRLAPVGGAAMFTTLDAGGTGDLWRTDGTTAGTVLLRRFPAGVVEHLSPVGARLFLTLQDAQGCSVWTSDGTAAGTTPVPGMPVGPIGSVVGLSSAGRAIALIHRSFNGPTELWTTDGSSAGTQLVRVLHAASVQGSLFEAAGLVFALLGSTGWSQLWRTDGTPGGTLAIFPDPYRGIVRAPISAIGRNRLLFSARFGTPDFEPWITDGSAAGTVRFTPLVNNAVFEAWDVVLALDLPDGPLALFGGVSKGGGWEPYAMPAALLRVAEMAAVQRGCSNSGGPDLATVGDPVTGNQTFALRLDAGTAPAQAHAPVALLLGLNAGIPVAGCAAVLPVPLLVLGRSDASGVAMFAAPIPADPALVGARLFVQPALANPAGAWLSGIDLGAVHALLIGG